MAQYQILLKIDDRADLGDDEHKVLRIAAAAMLDAALRKVAGRNAKGEEWAEYLRIVRNVGVHDFAEAQSDPTTAVFRSIIRTDTDGNERIETAAARKTLFLDPSIFDGKDGGAEARRFHELHPDLRKALQAAAVFVSQRIGRAQQALSA